eukprot:14421635-Ditylum_brightwellii.AAC.1
MDLPIANPMDKDHFLAPEDTWKYIDKKKPSFNDLIKHLPNMKKDTKESRRIEKDKIHSKNNKIALVASKVCAVAKCDSCAAQRYIYSMKQVGSESGPTQKDFNSLQQWVENRYLYGAK